MLSREEYIEALLDTAREAANNNTSEHPEDLAYSMSFAIESAVPALNYVHTKNRSVSYE